MSLDDSNHAAHFEKEIISPHFDDAVYSCWHQITAASRIITIFAGFPTDEMPSDWDRSTGFNNARVAIESRQAENTDALATTGAAAISMAFKDTVFRQNEQLDASTVASAIKDTASPGATILAPVGFSFSFHHPDHILSREAAKILLEEGANVLFYADIPYSIEAQRTEDWPFRLPLDTIIGLLGIKVELLPHRMSAAEATLKETAVRKYASQFQRNDELSGSTLQSPLTYQWECIFRPV